MEEERETWRGGSDLLKVAQPENNRAKDPNPGLFETKTCMQISCSQISALPLTSCVTLSKLLNISVPSVASSV